MHFCRRTEHLAHTSRATPQFQRACIPVSASNLHTSHLLSCIIFLCTKFTRVGSILQHARLPKTLILFGNFSFHRTFHTAPPTAPLEHSAQSVSLCNCRATWYPDLTVYSPDLVKVQTIESKTILLLSGTCSIASPSCRLKCCIINSLAHHLVSGSIRSATMRSSSTIWAGCKTLLVG